MLDSIRQEISGEGFEDMGDLHLTIRGAILSLRAKISDKHDWLMRADRQLVAAGQILPAIFPKGSACGQILIHIKIARQCIRQEATAMNLTQ